MNLCGQFRVVGLVSTPVTTYPEGDAGLRENGSRALKYLIYTHIDKPEL